LENGTNQASLPNRATPMEEEALPTMEEDLHVKATGVQMNQHLSFNAHEGQIEQILYTHRGDAMVSFGDGESIVSRWASGQIDFQNAPALVSEGIKVESVGSNPTLIMTLSSSDSYLFLGKGGALTLFNNTNRKSIIKILEAACTAFSCDPSDNNFLALGCSDGKVIFKYAGKKPQWPHDCHEASITSLVFNKTSKESGTIITASEDGTIKSWKLNVKKTTPTLERANTFKPPAVAWGTAISKQLKLKPNKDREAASEVLAVFPDRLVAFSPEFEVLYTFLCVKPIAATYSCNGNFVYVIEEGTNEITILSSDLTKVGIVALEDEELTWITAHPVSNNHFAVSTTSGNIHLLQFAEKV